MQRGEVYWVNLSPTLGREQQGHRPVVILTKERFNAVTQTPLVAMITTGDDFAKRNGFVVELSNKECVAGRVRCDQLRSIAIHRREPRLAGKLSEKSINSILEKAQTLLD